MHLLGLKCVRTWNPCEAVHSAILSASLQGLPANLWRRDERERRVEGPTRSEVKRSEGERPDYYFYHHEKLKFMKKNYIIKFNRGEI